MMVPMLSCLQWASKCSLEMVFGQKTRMILLKFFVWKTESFFRSLSVILQHSEPYNMVESTQLWYNFSLVFMSYCWDLQTLFSILNAFLALLRRFIMSLSTPLFINISYNAAQVGEIFDHWKNFSVYLHWLGIWDIECHHLCLLQVDPQTYLFSIFIKMVCLILYLLVCVGDQSQIVSKVQIFKCREECPSHTSWLVFCSSPHHPVNGNVKKECRHHTALPHSSLHIKTMIAVSHLTCEVVVEAFDEKDDILWYSIWA